MALRYLIDTTVIYSYTLRDIFITLATRGLPVHWSVQIEAEFIRARGRVSADQAVKARRVVALMRRAVPDWEAVARRTEIARLHLPDRDDRHVLAAAIQVGAQAIVTDNRRDFPAAALAPYGIRLMSPDQALCELFDADPEGLIAAASEMRARMLDPPYAAEAWLQRLKAAGVETLAERLRPFAARI